MDPIYLDDLIHNWIIFGKQPLGFTKSKCIESMGTSQITSKYGNSSKTDGGHFTPFAIYSKKKIIIIQRKKKQKKYYVKGKKLKQLSYVILCNVILNQSKNVAVYYSIDLG